MPNTNVTSRWECGKLVFKDKCLNDIATFDGCNRTLTINSPTAAQNTHGALPEVYRLCAAGCGTNSVCATVAYKTRVIDFWTVQHGAGAACDTAQLFNGCTAITDALDISGCDQDITRASSINNAQHEICACGTLKMTVTDNTGCNSPATTGYVLAIRVS